MSSRKGCFGGGEPFVWLTGSALDVGLIMVAGLLLLILESGMGFFWPADVVRLTLEDGGVLLGQVADRERIPEPGAPPGAPPRYRIKLKQGNRDPDLLGVDFLWIDEEKIVRRDLPPDAVVVERQEWGNLYGFLEEPNRAEAGSPPSTIAVSTANGLKKELTRAQVVRIYHPNRLSWIGKAGLYLEKAWEFVSTDPRESNTEGGVFPAIFGTVLMVIIMSLLVTPLGVLAALYLREYARQGPLVSAVRIAVNNLAGVPSIVFGVFGVGFFIYFLGGGIDRLFYADSLPTPTFGTGGILWASLTLALLTVPVVVVATEEGLAAIPRGLREASLALGATRFETTWRVVLPAATPSILTGLILAMARAAGEVAPLMITGVVKLAPSLAVDGSWPFVHLERKFMHLGFHVYDVGFQSPNIDAARPMVFATAVLLVLIVLVLNLTAISLRNRLRRRHSLAAL